MAKFLSRISGKTKEVTPITTSSGAGDASKIPQTDSDGRFHISLMPSGIGPATVVLPASEALSAGNFVNIWNDAGTIKVRKSDATTAGKEADGFVLSAVSSSANATVYKRGTNTSMAGLTAGSEYYLSTTAGGVTALPGPTGAGNVSQFIGKATSATELEFEKYEAVELV